jgi:hypothetical protein
MVTIRDIVVLAMYFAPDAGEDALLGHIMCALGGKANPVVIRDEIRRQMSYRMMASYTEQK